ncbi:hypothetical protein ACQ4PT_039706 [Festuca glaucescens]
MVLCVLITVGFQGGPEIGHAFGVAVIWVMLITTALMTVVMVVIWEVRAPYAAAFFAVYLAVEGVYMSSLMNKMAQGGWVPFAITAFFLSITLSWTYGRKKKSEYEAGHMITTDELAGIVARSARVPGVCFFFTDLMNGVPPIVRHYAEHTGSLRELLVFVTVRTLPVTSVLPEERFLVAAMDEVPAGVYRCVAQYGYMDTQDMEGDEFLESIVAALKDVAGGADEAAMMDRARRNGLHPHQCWLPGWPGDRACIQRHGDLGDADHHSADDSGHGGHLGGIPRKVIISGGSKLRYTPGERPSATCVPMATSNRARAELGPLAYLDHFGNRHACSDFGPSRLHRPQPRLACSDFGRARPAPTSAHPGSTDLSHAWPAPTSAASGLLRLRPIPAPPTLATPGLLRLRPRPSCSSFGPSRLHRLQPRPACSDFGHARPAPTSPTSAFWANVNRASIATSFAPTSPIGPT